MRTVPFVLSVVGLSLSAVATARAQVPAAGLHLQFEVEPLARVTPTWPKQRIDVTRTAPLSARSATCRMPVVRESSRGDSMPIVRRDTTIEQTMPVIPGTCDSTPAPTAKTH